jgi:hypothetical protein
MSLLSGTPRPIGDCLQRYHRTFNWQTSDLVLWQIISRLVSGAIGLPWNCCPRYEGPREPIAEEIYSSQGDLVDDTNPGGGR